MTAAKPQSTPPAAGRSGRPTREQSELLTQRIIDVAMRLFCESSFESTSVDQIVADARISKQTFYARFPSKEALFAAVIRKGADDVLKPVSAEHRATDPVDATLTDIGLQMLRRGLLRKGLLLQRLAYTEAQRFPQLAAAYRNSFSTTSTFVAQLFSDAMQDGQVQQGDPLFLAEQFLHAVVDGPLYSLMLAENDPPSDVDLEQQVKKAVRLFLEGCLAR